METPKTRVYVLKSGNPPTKSKPSGLIPTSKEFLDAPAPEIIIQGRSFCFTGVFDFANGDRNQCQAETKARGGFCYERPNRALNYLVVGNYAEPSWGHGSFGRKIIAVLEFKRSGAKCLIVSEENWARALRCTPELRQESHELVQGHSKSDQLLQLQRDLDQLRKHQQLLVDALQEKLTQADYRELAERLRNSGLVI